MTLPEWEPHLKIEPAPGHRGESSVEPLYFAVGNALSRWEHLESGLTRLFQLMCESPSFAACRAYGVLDSPFTKAAMLHAATEVFFANRNALESAYRSDLKTLYSAYGKAQQFRNNIAHGIGVGYFLKEGGHSGYFLSPPSYSTRKVAKIDPNEVYLLGASYWYKANDIDHYAKRFTDMLAEVMRLIAAINNHYHVLKDSQLHP
jgi:hypothetical protein